MRIIAKPIHSLALAAYGMHFADQTALVAVPLAAALAFDASAQVIGLLVACQALAHLLGSLPFGLLVDRCAARRLSLMSALVSGIGLAGATLGLLLSELLVFAVSVTLAGFGVVLFVLVCLSIIPRLARPEGIAKANAMIEAPRALASCLIPLAIAAVIVEIPTALIFGCAALCAFAALSVLPGLPAIPAAHQNTAQRRPSAPLLCSVLEGGRFILKHELLLPILLCALFWNLAFSALLVVLVPLLVDVHVAEPGSFAIALAAFGLGAVLGSWLAGRWAMRIPPNVILLFGPGSSALAACVFLLLPASAPVALVYLLFLLLGFGPAMWLIAQNAVRQLVTPCGQLGSVNAVIQTAIYGVRPLGALLGGAVAGDASPEAGLVLVAVGFLLSFASALFSRLRRVHRFADLAVHTL